MVCRGSIESGAGQNQAESLHDRIRAWVTRCGLDTEFEPRESEMLRAPLGTLEANQVNVATWEVEGLAILVWALGLSGLPPHDERVDPFEVTDRVWFLHDEAAEMMLDVELRAATELRAYRELVYAIHCRLDDFSRTQTKKDFRAWTESGWFETLGLAPESLIVDNDLAIGGTDISRVEPALIETCTWLTLPRHRASIWLLGDGAPYSKTYVST
ncbi:MAG: hypothetical protein B7Z74_01355 [Deltaproteobacteria bacterium 21-66-5]|nr:MAG: hypothetical protein B7Z74_01355 [Deltaproteobacteria bacterium 21-66-5]